MPGLKTLHCQTTRLFGALWVIRKEPEMCGISGFLTEKHKLGPELSHVILGAMTKSLTHRGPDQNGTWVDVDDGIGLGHNRLSILDLSLAGKQPMRSRCKRYIIVFNGEIYNHEDIRNALNSASRNKIDWKSSTDTEVLLECIMCHGISRALVMLNGMFAFALWDTVEKKLTLARDNIGEKPLYYGLLTDNNQRTFVFS